MSEINIKNDEKKTYTEGNLIHKSKTKSNLSTKKFILIFFLGSLLGLEMEAAKLSFAKPKHINGISKIKGLNFTKKVFLFMENSINLLNIKPKFSSLNIYILLRRNTSFMGADFTNLNLKENEVVSLSLSGLYSQVSKSILINLI